MQALRKLTERLRYQVLGQDDRSKPWVFGIGLSKTGTSSLDAALEVLGFRTFHMPPMTRARPEPGAEIRLDWTWWVHRFDALTDLSPAAVWQELDARYPNARFIYTPREMERWLDSCRRQFTPELNENRKAQGQLWINDLRTAFYGAEVFDRDLYRAAYKRHEAAVLAHFEGRDDFLQYDLIGGAGWEPLCAFLDRPVPDRPFPKANVGRQDERRKAGA